MNKSEDRNEILTSVEAISSEAVTPPDNTNKPAEVKIDSKEFGNIWWMSELKPQNIENEWRNAPLEDLGAKIVFLNKKVMDYKEEQKSFDPEKKPDSETEVHLKVLDDYYKTRAELPETEVASDRRILLTEKIKEIENRVDIKAVKINASLPNLELELEVMKNLTLEKNISYWEGVNRGKNNGVFSEENALRKTQYQMYIGEDIIFFYPDNDNVDLELMKQYEGLYKDMRDKIIDMQPSGRTTTVLLAPKDSNLRAHASPNLSIVAKAEGFYTANNLAHEFTHSLFFQEYGHSDSYIATEGTTMYYSKRKFPNDIYANDVRNTIGREELLKTLENSKTENTPLLAPLDKFLEPLDTSVEYSYFFGGIFATYLEGTYGKGSLKEFYRQTTLLPPGRSQSFYVRESLKNMGYELEDFESKFDKFVSTTMKEWLEKNPRKN